MSLPDGPSGGTPDPDKRPSPDYPALSDTLLSHLAYKEHQLVEPLARLGFCPSRLSHQLRQMEQRGSSRAESAPRTVEPLSWQLTQLDDISHMILAGLGPTTHTHDGDR